VACNSRHTEQAYSRSKPHVISDSFKGKTHSCEIDKGACCIRHVNLFVLVYLCVCVCMYVCVCLCVCVCVCIHTYIYIYIYIWPLRHYPATPLHHWFSGVCRRDLGAGVGGLHLPPLSLSRSRSCSLSIYLSIYLCITIYGPFAAPFSGGFRCDPDTGVEGLHLPPLSIYLSIHLAIYLAS